MHPSYLTHPIDRIENSAVYYVANLIQYGLAIHTSILLGTMETLGPNLMLILTAYLKILNQRLRELGWNKRNDKKMLSKIRDCVEFHKDCIELRDKKQISIIVIILFFFSIMFQIQKAD